METLKQEIQSAYDRYSLEDAHEINYSEICDWFAKGIIDDQQAVKLHDYNENIYEFRMM